MTTRETLVGLAAICEQATGPDREIDEAIADALFTEKQRHCVKGLSDEEGGQWFWRNPDGSIGTALRFTASLDAAVTLVPEGRDWMVDNFDGLPGRRCSATVFSAPGDEYASHEAFADTPALALTAGCLRARAEALSNGEGE
jgi:hypothetical protein